MFTILYPAIFIALVCAVTLVRRSRAKEEAEKAATMTQGWKISLLFAFIVYPSVSRTILQMWNCRDIEGTWYLIADYRLTCDEASNWGAYASMAAIAFLAYPIGIPAWYLYLLLHNKDAL